MISRAAASLVVCVLVLTAFLLPIYSFAVDAPDESAIRSAVAKALPLIEAGAMGAMEQRKQCFTCHNAGLPIIALSSARERGFAIDSEALEKLVEFTADVLGRNRSRYLAGTGQGGHVMTAGYALWALDAGGRKADATTDAVTGYLLGYHKDLDHYKSEVSRPPSEQSDQAFNFLALRGLKQFGTEAQKDRIAARTAQVKQWVLKAVPTSNEDQVFRLRTLRIADAPSDDIAKAVQDLLRSQREDGGWSQLSDMTSDAYATATALAALHEAGGLSASDAQYRRGLRWLLAQQLPDGSWRVKTRSKPIQTYFESGYPHKQDQFISMAAASWATVALTFALPPSDTGKSRKY